MFGCRAKPLLVVGLYTTFSNRVDHTLTQRLKSESIVEKKGICRRSADCLLAYCVNSHFSLVPSESEFGKAYCAYNKEERTLDLDSETPSSLPNLRARFALSYKFLKLAHRFIVSLPTPSPAAVITSAPACLPWLSVLIGITVQAYTLLTVYPRKALLDELKMCTINVLLFRAPNWFL